MTEATSVQADERPWNACEGCGVLVDTTGWCVGPGMWMKCPDCRHHEIFVAPAERRRERVARAIAEAADDGVFDRDDPDCTTDDDDRAYWLTLADAAIGAHDTPARKGRSTKEDHDG